ncbi:MAG: amidase [Dehalococcoidales bacterium]|nr:amidase [Dehalococcoidales bacterium]
MVRTPCELTVAEAASKISTGELSVLQLVESCLDRIDALEDKIQAWVLLDREGALAASLSLDDELRKGQRRGPLHGIPVGIKDIFYTAGLRTEAGSRSWSGFVPSYDATAVARLKEAGAVVLGKTHTTEFAHQDVAPTRNPWNTSHTPGGSSSGSGAAVAAGMCLAAFGSQTGGSTLRPAAYNGIVGLKPQHGRISAYGVVPLSWTMDHVGILARTVEDCALIFQAVAGYDAKDLYSLNEPVPDCLIGLNSQQKPRLGLVRQHFFDHADEEMRCHTEEVAGRLRQAGAIVEEVTLSPDFAGLHEINRVIMSVESATYHREMFAQRKELYRPRIRKTIEEGLATPATEYARSLQSRLQQRAGVEPLLHQFDALLAPGAPGTAPKDLTITGDPVMQRPWTTIGLPSISLPTGLGQNGLPLAVQLLGAPLAEDRLLAVARWCERTLDVHLSPPLD